MEIKIIYEDNDIMIVDKPQGLPTGIGNNNINLVSIIFKEYPFLKNIKGYNDKEGGLLNRLDNETGGLVLFAKSDFSFNYYKKEMKSQNIKKVYTAIVYGMLEKKKGVIEYPISHDKRNRKRMKLIKELKNNIKVQQARTEYEVIETFKNYSILNVVIYKGVRHQIRIHLAGIGHPIVGDRLYSKYKDSFSNHFLYATGVEFFTPLNEKRVISISPFFKEYEKINFY